MEMNKYPYPPHVFLKSIGHTYLRLTIAHCLLHYLQYLSLLFNRAAKLCSHIVKDWQEELIQGTFHTKVKGYGNNY